MSLTLRPKPIFSIEAVCVAATYVDLVGARSDIFSRHDNERWRKHGTGAIPVSQPTSDARDSIYDEVINQLGEPKALLIFGPGEAKLQLKARLSRSKPLFERIVGVETTDKLTDPQIVAKVKEHYGIDR